MTMLHLLKKLKNQDTVLPLSRQYCDSAASEPIAPGRRIVRRFKRAVPHKKVADGIRINVQAGCKCSDPALNVMSPAPASKQTIGGMLDSLKGLIDSLCCIGFIVAYFYDKSSKKDEQLKQQGKVVDKGKTESTK